MISPVVGSVTMIDPYVAPTRSTVSAMASSATRCTLASIPSTMSIPSWAGTFSYAPPAINEPSRARSRMREPFTPVNTSLYCFSRPVMPSLSTFTTPSTWEARLPLGYTRLIAGSNSMPAMPFLARSSASSSSTWRLTYTKVPSRSTRSSTTSSSMPSTSTRASIARRRCFFLMSDGFK